MMLWCSYVELTWRLSSNAGAVKSQLCDSLAIMIIISPFELMNMTMLTVCYSLNGLTYAACFNKQLTVLRMNDVN